MKSTSCSCKENILKYAAEDEEQAPVKTSIFFPEGTSFIFEAIECIQNEITTKRTAEGLKKILEEFENENDIPIADVVSLIHELDGTDPSYQPNNDRIIAKLKRKIEFEGSCEHMKASQCLTYLNNEIKTEAEEEILKAFQVFDEKNTGKVTLSELKYILGERGNKFTEEEMKLVNECSKTYHVESSNEKPKEELNSIKKLKKPKPFQKIKKSKASKVAKETENHVTETQVDYKRFVKALLEQISTQETKLKTNQS